MAKKKSKKVGCLTVIGVLVLIGMVSNLLDGNRETVRETSSINVEQSTPSSSFDRDAEKGDNEIIPVPTIEGHSELQSLFIHLVTDWNDKTYKEISEILEQSALYYKFNQKTLNISTVKPADGSLWGTEEDYIEIFFDGKLAGVTNDTDQIGSVIYYIHSIPNQVRVTDSEGIILTDYNIPSNVGAGNATDYKFSELDEVWQYINGNYPDTKFD